MGSGNEFLNEGLAVYPEGLATGTTEPVISL